MKLQKKISLLFLFAALLTTASCTKDDTPADVKTPVGFRAMSQSVMVKGDSNPERKSLSEYGINTFGVWGVARNDLNVQYLWNQPADDHTVQLSPVTKGSGDTYVPTEVAYWFSNSTHDFLALASKEPGTTNTFGTTGLSITHTNATTGAQTDPVMTFTYDMSSKYNPGTGKTPDYTYDLLGAAAHNRVEKSIPASQDLVFWHLFSRIKIRVNFDGSTGSVQAIRLHNVDQDIAYSMSPSSDVQTPAVACTNTAKTTTVNPISFNTSSSNYYDEDKDAEKEWYLSIVPQNISDFKMFLDFTTKINGNDVVVRDYEIDLSPATDKPDYTYNNQYNWNITIGPKQAITFNVTVTPWTTVGPDDDGGIPEIEIK